MNWLRRILQDWLGIPRTLQHTAMYREYYHDGRIVRIPIK